MDRIADARWPSKGIDLSNDLSGQPPLTTPIGINVRVFEPSSLRGRGGSRPGTLKLPQGQVPTGAHLIQNLNVVITTDSDHVPIGGFPGGPTIPNPSSPGIITDWGFAPNGDPRATRSPQDVFPVGGTGFTPHKSGKVTHHLTVYAPSGVKTFGDTQTWTPGTPFYSGFLFPGDTMTATYSSTGDGAGAPVGTYPVVLAGPSITSNSGDLYVIDGKVNGLLVVEPIIPPAPKHCYECQIRVVLTKPAPDPLGWTGLNRSFVGTLCSSGTPGTAATGIVNGSDEGLGDVTLLVYIARWILNHVGSDGFGTVTQDNVSGTPSVALCVGAPCVGTIPADTPASPGSIGAIIGAG